MKKTNNSVFAKVLFVWGISAINAQGKKLRTLDEAIQLGVQNSKILKIDQAKIKTATANYIEAKNAQLP
jgi:hypothetical protein